MATAHNKRMVSFPTAGSGRMGSWGGGVVEWGGVARFETAWRKSPVASKLIASCGTVNMLFLGESASSPTG